MYKVVQLIVALFICVVLGYCISGLIHNFIDQHSLPFAAHFAQWMPGNYASYNCNISAIADNTYECQMYYSGDAFIYVRIDKYTGKIMNTTFSMPMGTLSQFLYQYGEPWYISTKDKWSIFHWHGVEAHLYGEYSPDSVIMLATYF